MKILVIQHMPSDPPGIVGECVHARGGALEIRLTAQGDLIPASAEGFDGLLILGGIMNAEEDTSYPHLRQTVDLVHQFHAAQKPILGICLGAQIIARAFGKRVYRHDVFELGFTPIVPLAAAAEDRLLRACPQTVHLMQWHFDTFELPEAATLLMSSQTCRNQAYRIADNVYGFQFHMEVTREIVQAWLGIAEQFITENHPDFPARFAQQLDAYMGEADRFCRMVSQAWLDLVEARKLFDLGEVGGARENPEWGALAPQTPHWGTKRLPQTPCARGD